jgi:hypothetical protein
MGNSDLIVTTLKLFQPTVIFMFCIEAVHNVQQAKFAYHTNESKWETLSQRRMISSIFAVFKAYNGERAWKAIGDRLQRPYSPSRVDHERKIRNRRQRTDLGKYFFVNRTIRLWNLQKF